MLYFLFHTQQYKLLIIVITQVISSYLQMQMLVMLEVLLLEVLEVSLELELLFSLLLLLYASEDEEKE